MEKEELQVFDLAFRFQLLLQFCLTLIPVAVWAQAAGVVGIKTMGEFVISACLDRPCGREAPGVVKGRRLTAVG